VTADQAQLAKAVFKAALEVGTDDRSSFVRQRCAGDRDLQCEVETLLAADAEAGTFLEPPTKGLSESGDADLLVDKQIGGYRVLRLIGAGGMGAVYEAMQDHPKRRVALKVIRAGFASPSALRRFVHETEILARLRHPSIAQIYEAGTHEDPSGRVPYFAMELVAEALPITEYAGHHRMSRRARLELFIQACDAVHHGHQRGVIHRDLKPGNIMIDASGRPKVIDFGVARATDADMTIASLGSAEGHVVGTLRYMSPEQCEGDSGEIDTRSDVYAMGVVLYELVTGRLPYDLTTTSPFDIPRIIRNVDARRPSSVDRSLRGDFETILLKALEKDRERRYQSVADLGRDIRRYLDNEPIEATTAAITCSFMVLVTGAAIALGVLYGIAESQRAVAEQRADALRRTAYFNSIALAQNAYEAENTANLVRLLDDCPQDLRGWEWHYLQRLSDTSLAVLRGHAGEITAVAVSPDGSVIASASRQDPAIADADNTIRLWDVASGRELRMLRGHEHFVTSVDFAPDGSRLASGSYDRTVRLWNTTRGEPLAVLSGHGDKIHAIAFSPDGRWVASASTDKTIRLWDTVTNRQAGSLRGHDGPVHDLVWAPDGQRLASAGWDGTIKLWDARTGNAITTLSDHEGPVNVIAISSDGVSIVSAGWDGTVRTWDVPGARMVRVIREGADIGTGAAFSPDGTLVSIAMGLAVRTWGLSTGRPVAARLGHVANVSCLAYAPGGTTLVSGGKDATVRLWDGAQPEEPQTLRGHVDDARAVAVSPDGTRAVSAGRDRTVRVWDVGTGRELTAARGHGTEPIESVAISSDGSTIVSGGSDGTVRMHDAATGQTLMTLEGHDAGVFGVAFSPDDRLVASASQDGSVDIRDAGSGRSIHTLSADGARLYGVAFSPDGRRVVSGGYGVVRVWDVASGETLLSIPGEGLIFGSAVFSPDGWHLAAACSDWSVRVWDAATGEPLRELRGHRNAVQSVAFSPDSRRIVSGGFDHLIKLWDVESGKPALTLRGHAGGITGVAFSSDGTLLVSASDDSTLKVWRSRGP
jgi:WD40 repeat protein